MNFFFSLITATCSCLIIYFIFFGNINFKTLDFKSFYENLDQESPHNELQSKLDDLLNLDLSSEQIYLLASDLMSNQHYDQASEVFSLFISKFPNLLDSDIYARYAESLYLKDNNTFNENTILAINNALFLDPSNYKALTLNGLNLYDKQNFKQALNNWAIALDNVESEDEKKALIIVMNAAIKQREQECVHD